MKNRCFTSHTFPEN